MLIHRLKMNNDKTKFILLGTAKQLSKVHCGSLRVGEVEVRKVDGVKKLGVYFNCSLKFEKHITTKNKRIQRLQDFAARVISDIDFHQHITPILISLHWPQVDYRIKFNILLLVYKSCCGQAPSYHRDMCIVKPSSYNFRGSNCNETCLVVPFVKHSSFGGRAFAYSGSMLWNSLPLSVRESASLKLFKGNLKTFFLVWPFLKLF
ncbi:hypothetical protein HOLleu_45191 [Holothuria leucospilota]|uniref:Uncharacterized protein n=1 Tax=Holothuria leucospilota TaxID=206669 RepID=A0A9Q1BA25_HOLLE|nr:hypothetical protein HOLleu_45191 [Holothuria leucospilota]